MAKIELLRDLPYHSAHGMKKGRILRPVKPPSDLRECFSIKWWVVGDLDELIGVHKDEAKELPDA